MKFIDTLLKRLNGFFSNTNQVRRIVIYAGIALILAVISFGSYYYYDRYYTSQPKTADAMIKQAEQAVRDNPTDPEVRLNLAEAYMVNRRFEDALKIANEVMTAYPDNQHAWLLVGVGNNLSGKYTDAIEPLQKFYDANKNVDMPGLNKTLQAAAYYLGDSYLQSKRFDEAVPVLEKAVEWSQTDSDAMVKLGMAYNGVQRYEDAVTMFQAATRFVPNYIEAYEGMATSFSALNEPDYVNYANGMVAYSKEDYNTARDLLLKVVQNQADFIPAFNGLGLTYESLGDLENARLSYETALKFNSQDFTASTGLQRVEALLNK